MSSRFTATGPKAVPRALAALIASVLLAPACITIRPATPPPQSSDVVVLLPDDQGKTGSILVTGSGGGRLLSKPGQAVAVAPGSLPGEPFVMPEREIRSLAGSALDTLPPPPVQFIFYFQHDTTRITAESQASLREALQAIRERVPVDISVVGHTDTVGSRLYNNRLSLMRARAVAALLVAEGVDPSILEIAFHGKDNPLVPTGDQVPEPRNRRVEVTVR